MNVKFSVQPGLHVVSNAFNMRASWERLMDLLFEGPLTDLEDDPDDEIVPLPLPHTPVFLPGASSISVSNSKTKSTNARHRIARAKARAKSIATKDHLVKGVSRKHRASAEPLVIPQFSVSDDVYASKPGWTGTRQELRSWTDRVVSLDDATKAGCQVYDWDGRYVHVTFYPDLNTDCTPSTTIPFVDRNGLVFLVLGGTPKDTVAWASVTQGAYAATDQLRRSIKFAKSEFEHRRGSFPTVRYGVSHGGGQLVSLLSSFETHC